MATLAVLVGTVVARVAVCLAAMAMVEEQRGALGGGG